MRLKDEVSSFLLSVSVSSTVSKTNLKHYKPTQDLNQQKRGHQLVQIVDLQRLQHDWRHDVQVPEKVQSYQDAFTELLERFESLWDGDQSRINIAKHCMVSTSRKACSIHSAANRASAAV